ncbi:hypothetical protein DS909_08895 [Phaeobacter gallaeciensis]|uniref:Uncharacterized protein n=1 Tax=Phaeobacter gallaeciensis TaxID=60890 RepID=A0A366X054_9RHOB|nr:hypothetical protein [Phaeobacter gallaeciensis]RBW56811.1 hypothetical protein DS909_08895 [Phaeobacter gallaeciensis]
MEQAILDDLQALHVANVIKPARKQIARYAGCPTRYQRPKPDTHVIECAGVKLTVDPTGVRSSNDILKQWQREAAMQGVFL